MSRRYPQSELTAWLSTPFELSSVNKSESEDLELPLILTMPVTDSLARCKIDGQVVNADELSLPRRVGHIDRVQFVQPRSADW